MFIREKRCRPEGRRPRRCRQAVTNSRRRRRKYTTPPPSASTTSAAAPTNGFSRGVPATSVAVTSVISLPHWLAAGSVLWKDSTAVDPVAVKVKVSGSQVGGPKGDSVLG